MMNPPAQFDHDRLDVYHAVIEFVGLAGEIVEALPRGRAYVKDQLARASLSIATNLAEGAGEFRRKDKARFYRMATRSATECAAIVDGCRKLRIVDDALAQRARERLLRVVSMLTRLAKAHQKVKTPPPPGTGTGTGTGV
jgi:four helix bundle protein